jgi:tRNA (guanosine-2'-O-)-methyltransferase
MTPQRFQRLRQVLARRQPDLTVLMDNVHKRHNFSAVLRSCDAVGVLEAHGVWPSPRLRPYGVTSGGAGKWLRIVTHDDIAGAIAALRSDGFRVLVAENGPGATDYRHVDFTGPTAIVLGAELEGVSDAARDRAHAQVSIPMQGMAESLNVSVAAAILLFEAQRQRMAAGLYDRCRLEPDRACRILFEWAHPRLAEYCRRRGLPYPPLDDDGQVQGPFPPP